MPLCNNTKSTSFVEAFLITTGWAVSSPIAPTDAFLVCPTATLTALTLSNNLLV